MLRFHRRSFVVSSIFLVCQWTTCPFLWHIWLLALRQHFNKGMTQNYARAMVREIIADSTQTPLLSKMLFGIWRDSEKLNEIKAFPQFMDGAVFRLRHRPLHRTYNASCHHAHIPVCLSLSTHHYTHRLFLYLSRSIGTHRI